MRSLNIRNSIKRNSRELAIVVLVAIMVVIFTNKYIC